MAANDRYANPKAFLPDGKSLAVLCGGQSIQLIDVETGATKHEIKSADSLPGGMWADLAIAQQGRRLVIVAK